MAAIPNEPVLSPDEAYNALQQWYQAAQKLKELRAAEILARKKLASYYFHKPLEGTNRRDLGQGYELKLNIKINRDVDAAALDQVTGDDIEEQALEDVWDDLFVYLPKLNTRLYRKLNKEQQQFVEQFLDIKEGTPSMDVVPGKATDNYEAADEQSTQVEVRKPAKKPAKKATRKKAAAKKAASKKAAPRKKKAAKKASGRKSKKS